MPFKAGFFKILYELTIQGDYFGNWIAKLLDATVLIKEIQESIASLVLCRCKVATGRVVGCRNRFRIQLFKIVEGDTEGCNDNMIPKGIFSMVFEPGSLEILDHHACCRGAIRGNKSVGDGIAIQQKRIDSALVFFQEFSLDGKACFRKIAAVCVALGGGNPESHDRNHCQDNN